MRLIDADELKRELDAVKIVIDEDILKCNSIHDELVYLLKKVEDAVMEKISEQPAIEAVPLDGEYIKQIRWERDIALRQLADIGCSLGRDMTDIKKKVEVAPVVHGEWIEKWYSGFSIKQMQHVRLFVRFV